MVCNCCVRTCNNTSKEEEMHVLPANFEKFILWTRAINRTDIQFEKRRSYTICDIHFSDDMKFPSVRNRTCLKVNSIPNLFLPQCDSISDSDSNVLEEHSKILEEQPCSSGINLKRGIIGTTEEEISIKAPKVAVSIPSRRSRSDLKRRLRIYLPDDVGL